jgi:DNA-binding NtrC family response regulator
MKTLNICETCRVLVVDDDASLAASVKGFLSQQGYCVETALSGEDALAIFDRHPDICVALVDLMMPLMDGLTLLAELQRRNPDLPVLIMTGFATIETAVEAMRRGAEDYVTKPLDPDAVQKKIGRVVEMWRLRTRVAELQADASRSFESLVYVSPAMQRVVERARAAAVTGVPVLLLGETGTGKEMVARAIHAASQRANGPFVPVNCAALPRELVESELFGYRKGAFTGANGDGQGMFLAANHGTLFLDEVGEMPKEIQAKLLRVLQDKQVRPVGSPKESEVDLRIIAATNRPASDLRGQHLRDDFYFRIATLVIEMPPLRSRPEDILVLSQHIAQQLTETHDREITLSRGALELLLKYSFPGNVRELENVLQGAAAVSQEDPQSVSERDLRRLLDVKGLTEQMPKALEPTLAMEFLEKLAIERALRIANGNRSKAATLLGISRDTLYRKMRLCDVH